MEAKQGEKALPKLALEMSKERVGIAMNKVHTAAECKKPRKPKGYGKGAPKSGKIGYGKGGGKSNINSISEGWIVACITTRQISC